MMRHKLHIDRKRHPRIYLEGYSAFVRDKRRDDNPYDDGTSQASAWDLGWEDNSTKHEALNREFRRIIGG
jgi:ribosome modulation factor